MPHLNDHEATELSDLVSKEGDRKLVVTMKFFFSWNNKK